MRILGISAFYHDSACALVEDGRILAAAQEERFTRKKHDAGFPRQALRYCLEAGGLGLDEVDLVAFYDKPLLKFERLLETYLAFAPRGFKSFSMAIPVWLREKLFLKDLLVKELVRLGAPQRGLDRRILFSEHHLSHAASAFFPSPFEDAAVLTMDGVGEWATTSLAFGHGNRLEVHKEIHFPHSLGLLYSAFTYYTGFKVNSGEYKAMGLAPYGEPRYAGLIYEHLIDLKADGSFRLNMDYFDYCTGLAMTNARFAALFGGPPRQPETPLAQRDYGLGGQHPGGHRGGGSAARPLHCPGVRQPQPVSGRGCGAQLRGQRQGAAGRGLRETVDSTGGGRCRRRTGRGARGLSPAPECPASAAPSRRNRPYAGGLSGSVLPSGRDRAAADRGRGQVPGLERRGDDRGSRPRTGGRQGARLVSGAHGVRAAGARRALHPGRRPLAFHAVAPEPQGEIPGVVQTFRPLGATRACRGLVRSGYGQSLPQGVVRVAFLGASTTWCAEVSGNDRVWSHLTVAALRQAHPGVAFDYVNGGVPGYRVVSSIANLERRVAPLGPDVIVIYHATNDMSLELRGLAAAQGVIPAQRMEPPSWLAERFTLWSLAEKNWRVFRAQRAAKSQAGRLAVDPQTLGEGFRRDLTALLQAAGRVAPVVAVATFATHLRPDQSESEQTRAIASALYYMPFMTADGLLQSYGRYNQIIREVAAATGTLLIGGERDIPGTPAYFNDSVHFTDAGSAAMAKRVSEALLRDNRFRDLVQR